MAHSAPVAPVPVDLKNPWVAGILAWLVPGLGHLYQGRLFKAALFAICILGTFSVGVVLGGSPKLGWGRVVYVDIPQPFNRPHFVCQLGAGVVSFPAIFQALRASDGQERNSFMYPPVKESVLDQLNLELGRYFELATVYTMIAGLLNLLAVFDAAGGPVYIIDDRESKSDKDKAAEVGKPADATQNLAVAEKDEKFGATRDSSQESTSAGTKGSS